MAQLGTVVVAFMAVFSTPAAAQTFSIEQGMWNLNINQDQHYQDVSKHMFQGSKVKFSVSLKCASPVPDHIQLSWLLLRYPCLHGFTFNPPGMTDVLKIQSEEYVEAFMKNPSRMERVFGDTFEFISDAASYDCTNQEFVYEHKTDQKPHVFPMPKNTKTVEVPHAQRYKREGPTEGSLTSQEKGKSNISDQVLHVDVADTWGDGNYLFVLHMQPVSEATKFSAEVTIRMFDQNGNYISASDYPQIPAAIVMGLVYVVYCLLWLTMMARNRKNPLLHRVHFCIGAVFVLIPFHYGLQLVTMEIINRTGQSVLAVDIFVTLVDCFTSSVFTVLFIALSLGYGVVRPRLNGRTCKYMFVGSLYFILLSILFIIMIVEMERHIETFMWFRLLTAAAFVILGITIFIWIIVNVVRTLRFLRTACHPVKRSVYVRFTISLVFYWLATVGLLILMFLHFDLQHCAKDWKLNWLRVPSINMLSAIFHLVIMILWRPTASNLKRVFAPLDENADEKELKDEEDTLWEKNHSTMQASALQTSKV